MKKKTIITTHIDTGSHGYLSVSKKDFILVGADPAKISHCSGHTLTRIYLEEDCDQNYFWDVATANGFEIVRKSGYNLKFNIVGYKPELFHYVPQAGDYIKVGETEYQVLHGHGEEGLNGIGIMHRTTRARFKIPASNPFNYITELVSTASDRVKAITAEHALKATLTNSDR